MQEEIQKESGEICKVDWDFFRACPITKLITLNLLSLGVQGVAKANEQETKCCFVSRRWIGQKNERHHENHIAACYSEHESI